MLIYFPPYAPPLDPLATCAHVLTNKLDGFAAGISAFEARERIEKGDVVLLDVRTPDEFKMMLSFIRKTGRTIARIGDAMARKKI